MKKPTASSNDDFSFDFGGSDELFPLNGDLGGGDKPPKGVKGYFKNVVKSVGNLGVKVAKDLYPAAFDFKDQFFESDSEGKNSAKSFITNIRSEVKKYGGVIKDVAKEVKNDTKKALLTGNFAGDDDLNLDDLFGGGDDFSFDFGGDDFGSNESEVSDSSGKKKSKLSVQETVYRTSRGATQATIAIGNRQVAATMGAAQSQIKHENVLFSQQINIMQEHHAQKMSVMKNIAINLGKVVQQNNLSNRAQMEYSAKSLAFTQDIAAMIKEIRSAQFALTKPAAKPKIEESKFNKVINGGGFNLKFLKGQLGDTVKYGFLGDILGVKEMIDSAVDMSDMGGGPGKMLKGMLYDSLRQGIVNRMISGNTRAKIDDFNMKMEGLPGALNRWFGSLENMRSDKGLGKFLSGLPFGDKITSFIKEKAGMMKLTDNVSTMSDRYKMGDPNKVHPFDNKAHHTLTEVIPRYLARIDAGVNHTEEVYFDFKSNGFKTRSSMQDAINESRRDTVDFIDNSVFTFKNHLKTAGNEHGMDIINDENIQRQIAENLMKKNDRLSDIYDDLKSGDKDRYSGRIDDVFKGIVGLDVNDENKEQLKDVLLQTLVSLRKGADGDDKNDFFRFQGAMDKYYKNMTNNNLDMESRFSEYGSGSMFTEMVADEQIDKQIIIEEANLKNLRAKLSDNKFKANEKNIKNKIRASEEKLAELRRMKKGKVSAINTGRSSVSSGDYTMSDLSDSSTHGLVQNIYNLLLEGIDVYTHNGSDKEHNERIKARKKFHQSQRDSKLKESNAAKFNEGSYTLYDPNNLTDKEKMIFERIKFFEKGPNDELKVISYDEAKNRDDVYYRSNEYDAAARIIDRKVNHDENLKDNHIGFKVADDDKSLLGTIKRKINKHVFERTGPVNSVINAITGAGNYMLNGIYGEISDENEYTKDYKDVKGVFDKGISTLKTNTVDKITDIKIGKKTVAQRLREIKDIELIRQLTAANGNIQAQVEILKNWGSAEATAIGNRIETEIKKHPNLVKAQTKLVDGFTAAKEKGSDLYDKAKETGAELIDKAKNMTLSDVKNFVGSGVTAGKDLLEKGYTKIKDRVYGNDVDEQIEIREKTRKEKEQAKKEERQEKRMDLITKILSKFDKKGLNLDSDTLADMGEINSQISSASNSGFLGTVANLVSKLPGGEALVGSLTGVGGMAGMKAIVTGSLGSAGKALLHGQGIKGAGKAFMKSFSRKGGTTALKSVGTGIKGLAKGGAKGLGGGIGKGIGKVASGTSKGVTKVLGGGVKGAKAAGNIGRILKGATKPLSTVAKSGGGLLKGATGIVKNLLTSLFGKGPLAKALGKTAGKKVIDGIVKGMSKFAANLTAKISALSASAASVVGLAIPIATAVIGFTKGCANAKKYVKVGKGMRIKGSMRVCCGLAEAVDGLLLGIPGIIAKLFGQPSLAEWLYSLIGSIEEKEALMKYKIYQDKRAKIYGISSATALTDFENHGIGSRIGRNILKVVTFGIADGNDQKEAKLLGFKAVDIFKYWKENKYEPLQDLYEEMCERKDDKGNLIYGGKKVVEDMNADKTDKVIDEETGEKVIDENDEENQAIAERIDRQNEFRKDFLNEARNYVVKNGIAWLTNSVTPELFEKMTGKQCKKDLSGKDRAKEVGKATLVGVLGGPVGLLAYGAFKGRKKIAQGIDKITGTDKASKGLERIEQRFKASGEGKNLREKIYKFFQYNSQTQDVMEEATGAIQSMTDKYQNPEKGPDTKGVKSDTSGNSIDVANGGENGGVPTSEQFGFKLNKLKERVKSTRDSGATAAVKSKNKITSFKDSVESFTDNFSKDIIKRLTMLDEIHKEQVRHNQVSEQFFAACLQMMGEIAKSSGNTRMSSQIDQMVQMVVK